MDPVDEYDLSAYRPGAAPELDLPAAGIVPRPSQGPQWDFLTAVTVRWLRYHFGAVTRIENPQLIGYVWTAAESSPIMITSLAEWKPETSNQRPAILVDRLEQNRDMTTRAIGDQYQGVRPGHYYARFLGAHVVHVLGGREGETDFLAKEVWRELVRMSPVVGPRLCLDRLLPMSVGKRQELGEHKQTFTVPILMTYGYAEAWRLYPTDEEAINAINTVLTLS